MTVSITPCGSSQLPSLSHTLDGSPKGGGGGGGDVKDAIALIITYHFLNWEIEIASLNYVQ